MRGHPVIKECFHGMMSYLPHVKERLMWEHFLWDIELSLEDRFYYIMLNDDIK